MTGLANKVKFKELKKIFSTVIIHHTNTHIHNYHQSWLGSDVGESCIARKFLDDRNHVKPDIRHVSCLKWNLKLLNGTAGDQTFGAFYEESSTAWHLSKKMSC